MLFPDLRKIAWELVQRRELVSWVLPRNDNTRSVPRAYSSIVALIIHVDQMMSVGN
jgi:hypothetical protein